MVVNYDRLYKAYNAIVNCHGEYYNKDNIKAYLDYNYDQGITDEFLSPALFSLNSSVEENDGFITFNFRKDRIREMLTALTNPNFNDMEVSNPALLRSKRNLAQIISAESNSSSQ